MSTPAAPQTTKISLYPGAQIAGTYRLENELSRGDRHVTFAARRMGSNESVAIKVPLRSHVTGAKERFERAADILRRVAGDHVVKVIECGVLDDGRPFFVMEQLLGMNLGYAIEQYGVCQIPDAIDYILQVAAALAPAHKQGIVHGNLTPTKLFLTLTAEEEPIIKVLGFGKPVSGASPSPEADPRVDIGGLGLCLYELLAGQLPMGSVVIGDAARLPPPIRTIHSGVTEGLSRVLEKAYAADVSQRYQRLGDFAAALAPYAPLRSQPALDSLAKALCVPPVKAGGLSYTALPQAMQLPDISLAISGYQGPMSTKAAAAFASGATVPPPAEPSGSALSKKMVVFLVLALALVVVLGALVVYLAATR